MLGMELVAIPSRKGKAALVNAGDQIKVINTHGQQVVDTWAFIRQSLPESTSLEFTSPEFMSMEHTRTALASITPRVGQTMVTNQRRPILTLMEDTSPGIHDTLLAACDRYRYQLLGCVAYHDNCSDNLAAALAELGFAPPETPSPWNLFMNIPVGADGSASYSQFVPAILSGVQVVLQVVDFDPNNVAGGCQVSNLAAFTYP